MEVMTWAALSGNAAQEEGTGLTLGAVGASTTRKIFAKKVTIEEESRFAVFRSAEEGTGSVVAVLRSALPAWNVCAAQNTTPTATCRLADRLGAAQTPKKHGKRAREPEQREL
jgi:hypothetical protein